MAKYRYTDSNGDELRLASDESSLFVTVRQGRRTTTVDIPHEEAPSLVPAILAAAGDTGHMVVSIQDSERTIRIRESIAAETMREQAASLLEDVGSGTEAEQVRNLPLLPDAGSPQAAGEKCPRCGGSAIDPEDSFSGSHEEPPALQPCRNCYQDPTDYRALLVAELLGEDREDAIQMLADDPAATWERAYAVWSLESADLERYRRGESPVLDRVATLERNVSDLEDANRARRTDFTHMSTWVESRLDALELAARERTQSGGAPRANVAGGGDQEATDG